MPHLVQQNSLKWLIDLNVTRLCGADLIWDTGCHVHKVMMETYSLYLSLKTSPSTSIDRKLPPDDSMVWVPGANGDRCMASSVTRMNTKIKRKAIGASTPAMMIKINGSARFFSWKTQNIFREISNRSLSLFVPWAWNVFLLLCALLSFSVIVAKGSYSLSCYWCLFPSQQLNWTMYIHLLLQIPLQSLDSDRKQWK